MAGSAKRCELDSSNALIHWCTVIDNGKYSYSEGNQPSLIYLWRAFHSLPMVEAVMDARRPSTQENGREMAIALVPIFPTSVQEERENINKRK